MSTFTCIVYNLQFALPVLPIVLSAIISSVVLIQSQNISENQQELNRTRRETTVTIIYFTIVYIVFNIPMLTYLIFISVDFQLEWKYTKSTKSIEMLLF